MSLILFVRFLKLAVFKFFVLIDWLFFKKNNVFVFGSQGGVKYFDNSRYLYEFILKNHPEIKAFWVSKKKNNAVLGEQLIEGSLKYYYIIFLARYVFVSYGMYDIGHVRFSRRTIVTQLWHGRAYKNIFFKKRNLSFLEWLVLKAEVRNYSFFVVNDLDEKRHLIECTGLSDTQFLVSGYPRQDALIQKRLENDLFKGLNKKFDKIITCAPTFRDDGASPFDFLTFDQWCSFVAYLEEKNILLIVRAHAADVSGLSGLHSISSSTGNVFFADASQYPDVQDILLVTDILISDYSGLMYDFSLISKNIIRYCSDIVEYRGKRGLVDGFESMLPGDMVFTYLDLVGSIEKMLDSTCECEAVENFFSRSVVVLRLLKNSV